jgi:hypothetical protein
MFGEALYSQNTVMQPSKNKNTEKKYRWSMGNKESLPVYRATDLQIEAQLTSNNL